MRIKPGALQGEFRWASDQAVEAAGLQGMVPHGLRHTAASLAINSGANIKVVQRMLGHKTATLTLDLYGHLFDDLDPVADSMNRGALTAVESLPNERVSSSDPTAENGGLPAA